jgi:dynein heavy chain
MKETDSLLGTALSLQPRDTGGGGGKSWADTVKDLAADVEKSLPPQFDYEKCLIDFPIKYDESMNTVLSQEMIRFNAMTKVVKKSLADVQKAVVGLVVLSVELEHLGDSMVNGQVPDMWMAVAYPSRMPLGSWSKDLVARLKFLQDWFESKAYPANYWISGFYFTQAFLTGTKQNFARRHGLPIDECQYETVVQTQQQEDTDAKKVPEDGAYVWGLYLDGARWDRGTHSLQESNPKELFVSMPTIHLLPKHMSKLEPVKDTDVGGTAHLYIAPCYKTSIRFGVLSTTGHSTNFVMLFRIPMDPKHNQRHWIKRGLAMLTQLDD